MRTLYLAGIMVLDLAVLALGGAALAAMDLDKAGTLGVLATVPVVLLVLPDFPVAHLALRRPDSGPEGTGGDRRTTVVLASALAAAGAVPLLLVTAANEGPVLLSAACSVVAAVALVFAFVLGDRVAARHRARHLSRTGETTLVPRSPSGTRTPVAVSFRGGPSMRTTHRAVLGQRRPPEG